MAVSDRAAYLFYWSNCKVRPLIRTAESGVPGGPAGSHTIPFLRDASRPTRVHTPSAGVARITPNRACLLPGEPQAAQPSLGMAWWGAREGTQDVAGSLQANGDLLCPSTLDSQGCLPPRLPAQHPPAPAAPGARQNPGLVFVGQCPLPRGGVRTCVCVSVFLVTSTASTAQAVTVVNVCWPTAV